MDNFLIESVIEKVDGHEKRLGQNEIVLTKMDERMSDISNLAANIKKLEEVVGHVQERMSEKIWPVEKLNEVSYRLKMNNDLLSNPVKTKVVHTAGKLGWIILFLSCTVILLAISLIETIGRLDQFKMNDLVWRYVKVINKDENLKYFQSVEDLYLKGPSKMKSFVEEEELHQKRIFESGSSDQVKPQADNLSPHSKPIEHKRKRR